LTEKTRIKVNSPARKKKEKSISCLKWLIDQSKKYEKLWWTLGSALDIAASKRGAAS